MPDQDQLLRRLALGLLGVALLVSGVVALNYFILQPRLIVDAPVGSTITVRDIIASQQIVQETASSQSTTIHVGLGKYAIEVATKTSRQLFYADAGLLQTYQYSLHAPNLLSTHTVSHVAAYDVIQADGQMTYLNTIDRSLDQLHDQGTVTQLLKRDTTLRGSGAQGIYPLANNQAVVVGNSEVWVLRGGQLQPLHTAGFPALFTRLIVGANPAEQSFVVATDQTIYWYSSPDADPVKILTLNKRFDQLAYGGKMVIAYSTRMPQATNDIKSAYSSYYAIDPLLIDIAHKSSSVLTTGPIVDAKVSPNATYATITPQGATTTSLYALQGRTILAQLENADAGPWWFTDESLVYGRGSIIWQYNPRTNTAIALGVLPSKLGATSVTYDSMLKQYYATTYDNATTTVLYKLAADPLNDAAEEAAGITVNGDVNAEFQLQYVNITRPTLIISTRVVSNNPGAAQFRSATLVSRQAALDYLHTKGIDTNQLAIIYRPSL